MKKRSVRVESLLEATLLIAQGLLVISAASLVIFWFMGLGGCASTGGRSSEVNSRAYEERLAEEWGIEVEGVRLTAAGYLLDFRYRSLIRRKPWVFSCEV